VLSLKTNSTSKGTETIVNSLTSYFTFLLLWSVVMLGVCVWFGLWSSYHRVKLSLEEVLLFPLRHGLFNGYNK
jgi:hypothetical protein